MHAAQFALTLGVGLSGVSASNSTTPPHIKTLGAVTILSDNDLAGMSPHKPKLHMCEALLISGQPISPHALQAQSSYRHRPSQQSPKDAHLSTKKYGRQPYPTSRSALTMHSPTRPTSMRTMAPSTTSPIRPIARPHATQSPSMGPQFRSRATLSDRDCVLTLAPSRKLQNHSLGRTCKSQCCPATRTSQGIATSMGFSSGASGFRQRLSGSSTRLCTRDQGRLTRSSMVRVACKPTTRDGRCWMKTASS